MPLLATHELDLGAIQLISDWINLSLPSRVSFSQWQIAGFGSTTAPNAQPDADPDHDGQPNSVEYFTGTDPCSAASTWIYGTMSADGNGGAQFQFTQPANRSAIVEVSADLVNWHTWNVPGNTPCYPPSPMLRTIIAPTNSQDRFFRVRFGEP